MRSDPKVIGRAPLLDPCCIEDWKGHVGWAPYSKLRAHYDFIQTPLPPNIRIEYLAFWEQKEIQKLEGGTFQYQKTLKHGVTTNQISTMAAELGVSFEGLSAKLSSTFSHSISIMNETDVQHSYLYTVPAHKRTVWSLWQLVEFFIILDENGDLLTWGSPARLTRANLDVFLSIPPSSAVSRSMNMAVEATEFDLS